MAFRGNNHRDSASYDRAKARSSSVHDCDDEDSDENSLNVRRQTLQRAEGWSWIEPIEIDEEEDENDVRSEIGALIDLTTDESCLVEGTGKIQISRRNSPILNSLLPYRHHGVTLQRGSVVEIYEQPNHHRSQFLEIQDIYQEGIAVFLRGIPYTRTRNLRGQLLKRLNEVCMVLHVDADDGRVDTEQAQIDVTIEDVIQLRHLTRTNDEYPAHRFPEGVYASVPQIEEKALLVCRWKYRLV
jgi:DNA (cytosine-5)-methyltransferase 1